MHHVYKTQGTCATTIEFDINENKTVENVRFLGGCNGNLKAISKLVNGMTPEQISSYLKGNTCGYKSTSCADQLAIAVTEALEKENLAK